MAGRFCIAGMVGGPVGTGAENGRENELRFGENGTAIVGPMDSDVAWRGSCGADCVVAGLNEAGAFGAKEVNGGDSSSLSLRRRRIQRNRTKARTMIRSMMKPPSTLAIIVFAFVSETAE